MKALTVARTEPRSGVDKREDSRRQQLIEATIAVIGKRGYARMTLADVTDQAKVSRGIANFYFKSKEALLLATLEHLTEEYTAIWRKAIADTGSDPASRLDALIEAEFSTKVCRRDRVAAWFAFWGEARTRKAYARVCTVTDEEYFRAVVGLVSELAREDGQDGSSAEPVANGLCAMMNGFLHDYLLGADGFDRAAARRACRIYLASLFPAAFQDRVERDEGPRRVARPKSPRPVEAAAAATAETLSAWTYQDARFHALEREHIFKTTWQLVGHVSEVPAVGDYATLVVAGERAVVVRGEDGVPRAFVNTCRHRAACVAPAERGHCNRAIVCPYHGWNYGFDGRLIAVPDEPSFPSLDRTRFGLTPLETETWHGFIFVRFDGGGPSVATMMAPYEAELAPYRLADMVPEGDGVWSDSTNADWKNVMDNYLEGYHLPVGHPGLQRLFGGTYEVAVADHGASRATSNLREAPSRVWSERAYQRLLPEALHLPPERRRAWVYYALFPNTAFNVYPHNVSFFQVLPDGPGRATVRARAYSLPDERRAMRAARWLGQRINHRVYLEDEVLVRAVQGGLASTGYEAGVLSEHEACLRAFHDMVRRHLPVARLRQRPADMRRDNAGRRKFS
ncbi:MAG: transcriptional regulator BetI [Alphaproteobacteria bacterium]|nr:transcriptional regulator BetI [Alphaproteobacteria bacterium]